VSCNQVSKVTVQASKQFLWICNNPHYTEHKLCPAYKNI
jgi:hypothetical protein